MTVSRGREAGASSLGGGKDMGGVRVHGNMVGLDFVLRWKHFSFSMIFALFI